MSLLRALDRHVFNTCPDPTGSTIAITTTTTTIATAPILLLLLLLLRLLLLLLLRLVTTNTAQRSSAGMPVGAHALCRFQFLTPSYHSKLYHQFIYMHSYVAAFPAVGEGAMGARHPLHALSCNSSRNPNRIIILLSYFSVHLCTAGSEPFSCARRR